MIKLKNNQQGMASMIVGMIIMLLITLIVISFALVVRKEQRQSLDRQLSTQAYYAAEVGVKDAQKAIETGAIDSDINNCDTFESSSNISSNVSYSCVLVDLAPKYIPADNIVDGNGSFFTPIKDINSANINKIIITWHNSDEPRVGLGTPSMGTLPQQPNTLPTALVRATIIPGSSLSSRTDLIGKSKTLYLYPQNSQSVAGSTAVDLSAKGSGEFVQSHCSDSSIPSESNINETSNACSVTIDVPEEEVYYLHLKPLYKKTDFKIKAIDSTPLEGDVELAESVATVDVTGRAQDVLRRIRASVPLSKTKNAKHFSKYIPSAAIETSEEICKLFEYNRYASPPELADSCSSP